MSMIRRRRCLGDGGKRCRCCVECTSLTERVWLLIIVGREVRVGVVRLVFRKRSQRICMYGFC